MGRWPCIQSISGRLVAARKEKRETEDITSKERREEPEHPTRCTSALSLCCRRLWVDGDVANDYPSFASEDARDVANDEAHACLCHTYCTYRRGSRGASQSGVIAAWYRKCRFSASQTAKRRNGVFVHICFARLPIAETDAECPGQWYFAVPSLASRSLISGVWRHEHRANRTYCPTRSPSEGQRLRSRALLAGSAQHLLPPKWPLFWRCTAPTRQQAQAYSSSLALAHPFSPCSSQVPSISSSLFSIPTRSQNITSPLSADYLFHFAPLRVFRLLKTRRVHSIISAAGRV